MSAVYISTAIEVVLILLLGWGAAFILQTSYVFDEVVMGFGYLYPLTTMQVYMLIFILVALLGIFLVFAFNTRGLKWYIIPLVALCVPTAISHSGLPEQLRESFGLTLEVDILRSTITLESMLAVVLLLVAGFVVLYQMISLREMSTHLTRRGVDDSDVSHAYKGRSISIIAVVLVSIGASYGASQLILYAKTRFESLLDLDPLYYLVIGVAAAFVAVAVIILLLVIQKPKKLVPVPQPKKLRQKVAGEAKAVLHMFIPSALTNPVGRLMAWASRPLIKVGRLGARRIKSSRRFGFLKRFSRKDEL